MMGVMKEVTQIVKGVNGGDDASEAIDDIKGLKGELKEIADRAKKIEKDQSDEDKKEANKEMEEKYCHEMNKVMGDLMGEFTKLPTSDFRLPTSGAVGSKDVAGAVQELMKEMN